jgi:hypothetical protein
MGWRIRKQKKKIFVAIQLPLTYRGGGGEIGESSHLQQLQAILIYLHILFSFYPLGSYKRSYVVSHFAQVHKVSHCN